MAIPPYRQKSFYFLFSMPNDQVYAQWVSDIGPDPTLLSYPMVLPAWFPRKSLLCHVWAGYGVRTAQTYPYELWMILDPRGQNYKAGDPPGAETWGGTMEPSITLLQTYASETPFTGQGFASHRIDPPVLFNRDAGDKLWYGIAGSDVLGYAYFNLGFMVPNTFAPTPVAETA